MVRRWQELVDGIVTENKIVKNVISLFIKLTSYLLHLSNKTYFCPSKKESTFPLRSTYHSRFLRHKQKYQRRKVKKKIKGKDNEEGGGKGREGATMASDRKRESRRRKITLR